MLRVYAYSGCSTCKKAVKWLRENGVDFEELPIRETPPTKKELAAMQSAYGGEIRRLFNTSGQDYRALGIKDRLPSMSEKEAIGLLAGNGNLVKRPFAIDAKSGVFLVGFNERDWAAAITTAR